MEMVTVNSSTVHSIGYDENDLYVKYLDCCLYRYSEVPYKLYESLLTASSKGKFLSKYIVGKYRQYQIE